MARRYLGMALLVASAATAQARPIERHGFGTMPDGRAVEAITLDNDHGVRATIITYGAALQALSLKAAHGKPVDVALGHATLTEYLAKRDFMGATVGRIANRIGGARFTLDGKEYHIAANEGANALHGGVSGFDRMVWEVVSTHADATGSEVVLRTVSPDGDQGFPGTLTVTARYRLSVGNALSIDYSATTDKTTVVAITNHAYWNLAGEGSPRGAMGLTMQIPADAITPVDAVLIPTGARRPVAGTVFDFRKARVIGERVRTADDEQIRIGHGYDHNWIVTTAPTTTQHLMARVADPVSGRAMELWSDQPGLQFYSGNFMDGTEQGKAGAFYRQGDAIVLEPQPFPDTVNHPQFGSVRLEPGQTFRLGMTYRFTPGR